MICSDGSILPNRRMDELAKYYRTTILIVEAKKFGEDVSVRGPDGKVMKYGKDDYMVYMPNNTSWQPVKRTEFESNFIKIDDIAYEMYVEQKADPKQNEETLNHNE